MKEHPFPGARPFRAKTAPPIIRGAATGFFSLTNGNLSGPQLGTQFALESLDDLFANLGRIRVCQPALG